MQIEDPLLYMETAGDRLTIPKYIVNASSDDFFLPDNSAYFYDALPGEKMLRVAPNSDHYGIQAFVEQSLIGFTNRLQQQRPLPTLNVITNNQQTSTKLDLSFSERPVKLVQWRAHNLNDRDFRLACRVKYEATPIASSDIDTLTVELSTPAQGWSATYIEATMADGLVITTPVVVLPDTYPNWTPTQIEPACKNLSDPT